MPYTIIVISAASDYINKIILNAKMNGVLSNGYTRPIVSCTVELCAFK